jgi:glycosyltransferase involved in cell wall biosynthesis
MVRDLTIPLLVAYLLKPFAGYKLFYQRTYPHEFRWFDPGIARRYKLPRLWTWCRRVENRLLHVLMRRCDAVLSISDAMNEQLVREENLPREILYTFGMGVNPRQMETHECRAGDAPDDGIIRLAYSGTLGPSRELESLLEAFAFARAGQGDLELRLEMYGGAKEDVERLQAHASALGVGACVNFTGELAREDMLQGLRRCDLAINYIPRGPRYWVSCPTKQIEYLALGLPSVATNTVEIVLSLAQTHGGIVLGDPDPQSFGRTILEACRELDRYRAEAQRARLPIREEFSYDAMAQRLMELSR